MNTLVLYSISYLSFALLLSGCKAYGGLRLIDNQGFAKSPKFLLVLHLGGILVFSLPLLTSQTPLFAFFTKNPTTQPSTWATLIFMALAITFSTNIAQKKYHQFLKNAPVQAVPGINFLVVYFIVRKTFILVYEIWFRGYLLSDSIPSIGLAPAIAQNVVLYMCLHIANGKEEVIACLPFGILLCGLCVWQNAVWPALAIHLSLTVPFELIMLKKIKMNKLGTHGDFDNRGFGLPRKHTRP